MVKDLYIPQICYSIILTMGNKILTDKEGRKYQICKKISGCTGCAFNVSDYTCDCTFECLPSERMDGSEIIFIRKYVYGK